MNKIVEEYPFKEFLDINIVEANEEEAYGYVAIKKEYTDMLNDVTGGLYTSLADAIGGACARANGQMYVTQGCSLQFYQSTRVEDGKLIARAKLRHRGSRTCIVAVQLEHENGEIVSDGQFSYSKI